MERVGIFDPNVCVPGFALRVGDAVGAHHSSLGELAEHDDDAAAHDHAETRRLAPEALIVEAQLVPVIVRGGHYVVHDEVRRDRPITRLCFSHGFSRRACRPPSIAVSPAPPARSGTTWVRARGSTF